MKKSIKNMKKVMVDIQQKVKNANIVVNQLEKMVKEKAFMKEIIIIEYLRIRRT